MRNKYIIFLFSFLFLILVGYLVIIYWLTVPLKVLEIKKIPVPVREQKVKVGEAIILNYNYCKYTNDIGVVDSEIESNKSITLLPSYPETTTEGCHENLPVPVIIPLQLQSDVYWIHYKVRYTLNPIRNTSIEWNSEKFQVVQ